MEYDFDKWATSLLFHYVTLWFVFFLLARLGLSVQANQYQLNNNNRISNASLLPPFADFIWITGVYVGHHIGTFYTFSKHILIKT